MKKRRRYAAKSRAATRRWHIPPPLIHGPETLEGGGILQEWGNELGVVLWQAFRDALLWATSDPEQRGSAFALPDDGRRPFDYEPFLQAEADSRLRFGLRTLQQLVLAPQTIREDQVARACRQISEWADDRKRPGTALAFAQNAALAGHSDAAAAFWVATMAVRLNDHARAEVWFRRAIGLARRSRDWRLYSRAFGGLGNLYMRRGNLPAARRLHTRALRGGRRGGMRGEQATALHDLFAVAVETGSPVEAERLAGLSLDAYGTRNRRVHVLAHDVAYFWMEQGHFARALPVFQAVLPLIDRPVERLFVLADVARAAAATGQRPLAEASAEEVWRLAQQPELEHGAGRALLEVARAHLSLDEPERAHEAASLALRSALEFRESKVRFAAEAILESLPGAGATADAGSPDPALPFDLAGTGDDLAAAFLHTLEVVAGTAH